MTTDVGSSVSALCFDNNYAASLSKTDSKNNHFLPHRNKGATHCSSNILQLKRGLPKPINQGGRRRQNTSSRSSDENKLFSVNDPELHQFPISVDLANTTEEPVCLKQARTISVHETYQLGYFDTTTDETGLIERLFVFDFVDGLEVSYPISVTSPDMLPMDLPPLFIEPEYVDQLSTLASNALTQLTTLLNNWLVACQSANEEIIIWRHMSVHEEAVSLRKQVIKLIDQLVPNGHLEKTLDLNSPTTDRFLTKLVNALTTNGYENVTTLGSYSENKIPLVSLCPDPIHCLHVLRTQIYQLLQLLVPQLTLPQSFQLDRDLQLLLTTLCEYNE